jgi:putative salt-induced outer membrane protein YdiY
MNIFSLSRNLGTLVLVLFVANAALAQAPAIVAPANPACACPACVCPGQVVEEDKEEGPWDASVNLGYNETRGNRDTSLLNVGGTLSYKTDKHHASFTVLHRYGDDEGDANIDDTDANTQWKRFFSERFYINNGVFFRRDDIADVRYRVRPGIFPGYFLWKSDTFRFNVEAGPTYVFEEVADVEDDYFAPEIAERMEWDFSKHASLFEEVRVTFDINDGDNYLVKALAGVRTSLTEQLSLVLGYTLDYDGVPGEGLESENTAFTTAIVYNFL